MYVVLGKETCRKKQEASEGVGRREAVGFECNLFSFSFPQIRTKSSVVSLPSVLDGSSLQRCFFNKLRDIACEWQKQLPSLRPLKRFLLISIHAIRNIRRKMEDRHVSLPEFNQLFGLLVSLWGRTPLCAGEVSSSTQTLLGTHSCPTTTE